MKTSELIGLLTESLKIAGDLQVSVLDEESSRYYFPTCLRIVEVVPTERNFYVMRSAKDTSCVDILLLDI